MKRPLILMACLIGLIIPSWAGEPRYFDLRIYDVTEGKLEGVLERFRETVDPVRRKHHIQVPGYWTANTTNGSKFIYLMTASSSAELKQQEKAFGEDPDFKKGYAASNQKHGKTVDKIASVPMNGELDVASAKSASGKPRVFDLRIYAIIPGKLEAFRERWQKHAVRIYQRHGLNSVGWWVAEKKDPEGRDQFICLLGGESLEGIQKSIGAFHADAEWQRVEKETEKDGKLRSGVVSYKMSPTDFSILK